MSWTVDPLASKDLGAFSRRWQTYFVRVLYVAITGYAVWEFGRAAEGEDVTVSDYATLGRDLFVRFAGFQLVLIPLAAIAAASDLVSREARTGTLGLLVLTGLSPERIAWAKWRAAMAYSMLLLLLGLPVVSIAIYLGAVGPWELAWSTAVTAALASVSAAMALRFSSTCESSGKAFFRTVLALGAWSLVLALVGLPAALIGFPLQSWLNPALAAVSVLTRATEPSHAWAWAGATYASGVYTWLLLRNAGKRIGRRVTAAPRAPKAEHDFDTCPSYYSNVRRPGRRRLVIERGVWDRRPFLWKELATRAVGRLGVGWRIALLWIFVAFGVTCWGLASHGRNLDGFFIPAAALLLYAVGSGSTLFAREREGRRWDLLLTTPARPLEIVASKLASGLVAPESLALWVLLGLGVLGWSAWAGGIRTVLMGLTAALFLAFAYVLAASASLRSRTPRGAFVFTMGFLSIVLVALPWLLSTGRYSVDWRLAGLSPVTALELLFSLATRWDDVNDLTRLREEAVWAFLIFMGVYGTATAGLVAATVLGVRAAPETA